MSKERLHGIWDRAAPAFDQSGPRFFAHSGRRLVELAHIPMGSDVLDVAAGRGAILFPTARQVGSRGRIVGVDLSMGMVHEAASEIRSAGLKHAQVCQMDGEGLAFADASFDFVLCGHAIFYFPHAVHEFYRVLRPGGHVGLTIVAKGCNEWIWEAFDAHSPPQEPQPEEEEDSAPLGTPAGLEALLGGAAFERIRVVEEKDEFVYADEAEWWSMMWTLGCRWAMEEMDPATLQAFRSDIYRRLQAFKQSDGIHIPWHVLFALGSKPH